MSVMKKALNIYLWRHCLGRRLAPVLLGALLSACSGSSEPLAPGETPSDQSATDQVPTALIGLQDDPELLVDIPDIVQSVTLSNTGLQVAYTLNTQIVEVPARLIEAQWEHMQSCLELVNVPPIVVVQEDAVNPFTASDDVIFGRVGTPNASSSRRDVPVIQVLAADFDGSLGNPGFNLRSIMGRLLWLSAGLAERDYPFECAREQIDLAL